MYELNDLLVLLNSSQAIISIETHEELRAVDLIKRCSIKLTKPVMKWSVTSGIVDSASGAPALSLMAKSATHNPEVAADPKQALREIASSRTPSVYILLDFHPYLDDPFVIRTVKEIAQNHRSNGHHLIFVSPELNLPNDFSRLSAQFKISLPDRRALRKLVLAELKIWKLRNTDKKFHANRKSIHLLVNNLIGLTVSESQRLIRNAIYDDDAISTNDLEKVQKAKYELIGQDGVLSFEFETASFDQVGGLTNLKNWLAIRREVFLPSEKTQSLDIPKGILLVGVQGCGKSLAARAVAGAWKVPLLRLDFGTLYNKFFGQTEKNMRQAIELAEVMSPCVLWIDEIEKGISTGDYDSGTSQRLLATLLTWMAENKKPVFIVATANNIDVLPPELIRKGRLDEVFFVDLPDEDTRSKIFSIHLSKRNIDLSSINLSKLVQQSQGFSGSEVEQVVVSALYQALALKQDVATEHLLNEIKNTRPLSIVMAEQISKLQQWASERTVMAH